jgi:hypothetical protein
MVFKVYVVLSSNWPLFLIGVPHFNVEDNIFVKGGNMSQAIF